VSCSAPATGAEVAATSHSEILSWAFLLRLAEPVVQKLIWQVGLTSITRGRVSPLRAVAT
jgi:hypothetical protein